MSSRVEQCRWCGAPIRWHPTVNGRPMPVDAEPNPDGNIEIRHEAGRDVAHVHAAGQTDMFGTGERWMPHFATCPAVKDGAS